jgi:hypothetical protein
MRPATGYALDPSSADDQRPAERRVPPRRPATSQVVQILLRRKGVLAALALTLAACSEAPVTAPPTAGAPQAGAVKFWEANAAVHWNGVAREMVIANRSPAPFAVRGYAVLSVAQYNAAVAAEKGKVGNEHPSVHAAIAGASVTALSYLYPAQAFALEVLTGRAVEDWEPSFGFDGANRESLRATVTGLASQSRSRSWESPWGVAANLQPSLRKLP